MSLKQTIDPYQQGQFIQRGTLARGDYLTKDALIRSKIQQKVGKPYKAFQQYRRRTQDLKNNFCSYSSSTQFSSQSQASFQQIENEDTIPLIEFKNVHKRFGKNRVLRGCSFKIYDGEAVGIIGSSGTGKSTLLKLIAGLILADQGTVHIKGRQRTDLSSANDLEIYGIQTGLVFQNAALFDSLSVKENVGFYLYEHSSMNSKELEEVVSDCLQKVGLNNLEDVYPAQLSGGMKKRAALARAICQDSRKRVQQIIMYDEPTAGLDPVASTVIENLMRSLHNPNNKEGLGRGIGTYIVVTHQHTTIRRAVDRLIFLHEGKVVWEGTPKEFDNSDNSIVRQFSSGSLEGPIVYI